MKTIKFLIAWIPARVFYYLGDWTSRVDWHWEWPYDFYQWSMTKSCDIDDWGDTKLWSKPVKE